jgi:hypothetical protein
MWEVIPEDGGLLHDLDYRSHTDNMKVSIHKAMMHVKRISGRTTVPIPTRDVLCNMDYVPQPWIRMFVSVISIRHPQNTEPLRFLRLITICILSFEGVRLPVARQCAYALPCRYAQTCLSGTVHHGRLRSRLSRYSVSLRLFAARWSGTCV